MNTKPIKELETRVVRTYRGGKLLDEFLHREDPKDVFLPEDWISSFVEAKNREPIPNEGITRVLVDGEEKLITEVVTKEDFGQGREEAGVLVKFLDSQERLGIQVHPTKAFSRKYFHSEYGKTECWHILATRPEGGTIYIGFKEYMTKAIWSDLYERQDVQGMLDGMHCFHVKPGDTILVKGGTPHAIGDGCLLLEIQEPSDYTMRVEKVTLAGVHVTPNQIHYGVGEAAMLDCFVYDGCSKEEAVERYFLKSRVDGNHETLVSYADTPCFMLERVNRGTYEIDRPYFVTVAAIADGGVLECQGEEYPLRRGDKYFLSASCKATLRDAQVLICDPPEIRQESNQQSCKIERII